MIDATMQATELEAPFIIKGFVKNDPECNYEIYLRELLNISSWFQKLYSGEFVKPESESNGECDANNPSYSIDFKLLASKTSLMARRELSHQIEMLCDGCWSIGESRKHGAIHATRLNAAFRDLDLSQIKLLRNNGIKESGITNDIIAATKTMETRKNLLLFFPYIFSFQNPHSQPEAQLLITDGLNHDFKSLFQYRSECADSFDTYFVCLYENTFILFQLENSKLVFRETINTNNVHTFRELMSYAD
jgi:hypothetical protein